jgi:hypothetical protein
MIGYPKEILYNQKCHHLALGLRIEAPTQLANGGLSSCKRLKRR